MQVRARQQRRAAWLLCLAGWSAACAAQENIVVVSANRSGQQQFDAAASIDAVAVDALHAPSPLVNLSELLATVPGIEVRERQNYAQDLQISVRGFGTRSSFGVRGVRILVDGIPATQPDGQGQAATAALGSATRIEVLRGPVAQLYGNAAGGVVQIFTADPPLAPKRPVLAASAGLGADGQRETGVTVAGGSATLGASLDALHYETDGYRAHSAARRTQYNGKLLWQPSDATRVLLLYGGFDQPLAQDPLGLTRAQFEQDPRGAMPQAERFDTRKTVRQQQGGIVLDQKLGSADSINARLYGGTRDVFQALALSGSAPSSAGGIVALSNNYQGAALNWTHKTHVAGGPLSWTVGVSGDDLDQGRRGYVNDGGMPGDLRRDETDRASNTDLYGVAEWTPAPRWTASGGLRSTRVRLAVDDHHVTAANPDASGAVRYTNTSPVIGLVWHAADTFNLYANVGRGFETPTLNEIAYRAGAPGANLALRPSTSTQAEVGLKWRHARQSAELALYDARSSDEIVPQASDNGRAVYQNVDGVTRRGIEAGWRVERGIATWRLAYTLLDARFRQAFAGAGNRIIAAGNRLPGAARHALGMQADLRAGADAVITAELHAESRVAADDMNTGFAPGYAAMNLRAARTWHLAGSSIYLYARLDNALDRQYAGSVIVNDSNGRFFEPAAGRRWFVGLRAAL